jgi:agmatine deiminase
MNAKDASTPHAQGFYMPAEWEPHAATWLAWPHEESDWPGKFATVDWVFAEIARVLSEGERVRVLVRNAADQKKARHALATSGVSLARVDFVRSASDRSWTRDTLPSFVVRRKQRRVKSALGAVRFRFNGWNRYKNHEQDALAGKAAARFSEAEVFEPFVTFGKKPYHFVLEGGAFDTDGEGTLLTTEECLLDGKRARNPALGRALTEQILSDYLGTKKVLWLGRGIAGDDTGGHIDDFARFVAPGRIVLSHESDKKDENYRVLSDARERLTGMRDAHGRRLEVIPLPMPAPVVFARQRLPASYANFYIGNAAVLVPTFNDPADRVALGVLSELFPERQVVGIHARDFVLGLGTLHCTTQQEPALPR